MPANEIQQEAGKLLKVSEALDRLALQEASVAEALAILARSVRYSAKLLEVVVAVRLGPDNALNKASN
jgi:hypothetical protein